MFNFFPPTSKYVQSEQIFLAHILEVLIWISNMTDAVYIYIKRAELVCDDILYVLHNISLHTQSTVFSL